MEGSQTDIPKWLIERENNANIAKQFFGDAIRQKKAEFSAFS